MRIAIYNQMFGLNGRSFWTNMMGHWAVHYQANPEKIWKRANVSKTIDIIAKSNVDIMGIAEVLEGQEEELKKGLKEKGYNFFYIGKGHRTKYSGLYVQELIASRIKGKQKDTGKWPVENTFGGGGGLAHVYYSKSQFHLIMAHLGLPSKKCYWKQISFLQDYIKRLDGKIIILGDFNLTWGSLKPCFAGFNLISGEAKSCSTTPIINWFYNKDVDHILASGFKPVKCGAMKGNSDHKLVYADVED